MQDYFKLKNVMPLFFMFGLVGCFQHYYKDVQPNLPTESDKASVIDSLNNQNRYFILRSGNRAYTMKNVSIQSGKAAIKCILDDLTIAHVLYLSHGRYGKMVYKPRRDLPVLTEVHLFIPPDSSLSNGNYSLSLSKISKIAIIEKDKRRTTTNFVLSSLGAAAGVATVVGVIGMISTDAYQPPPPSSSSETITTCSPQVYTIDSNEAKLNGTLCSGAIYASLKRTDYLPVNKTEKNSDELNLLLRGEKNEELMMNDFQLVQVTHSSGQKILVDKNGEAFTYKNPVVPEHAFIGNGKDVVNQINAVDEESYSFNNAAESGSSNVIVDFKKPIGASSGKLIIRGKNSQWAYYVFNEFKKLYGNRYQSLLLKKDKQNSAKVLQCEIDQSLPLLVSVKESKGWKLVDYFFTPGNAAFRDMIMQLNLKDFKNEDHIQIKLQTAFQFWDVDYAAMDFSNDQPVSVSRIKPSQFYKSNSVSHENQFLKDNTSYLHINGEEQLHLSFTLINDLNGKENSYFLEGNGYYHDHTIFKGNPQISRLKKCSGKGGFDRFSRRKFEEKMSAFNQQKENAKKDYEILQH